MRSGAGGKAGTQQVFQKRCSRRGLSQKSAKGKSTGSPVTGSRSRGLWHTHHGEAGGAPGSGPNEAFPGPALAFSEMIQQNQGA